MNHSDKGKLIDVYRRYGFTLAKEYAKDGILVFTLKNGYFDNADIVPFASAAQPDSAFSEFTRLGFACTNRPLMTPSEAERQLFQGFFSVEATCNRLADDYKRFTSAIVKPYSDNATYNYIDAPYTINGRDGERGVPDEVRSRLADERPTLFLIEAAAGFGKTCTAYELVNLLLNQEHALPLYAELSRNRQARIFRHILLDEIDRTFPLLSSRLVQSEIQNGRVVVILDGFDELLRKGEETGSLENREPMLETISEFLTGHAKIVLTTRRTVLFDGDEFHQWLERHANDFALVRVKISEPRVSDWLSADRLSELARQGLVIENIANPVLLSYLRCISDNEFSDALTEPELIVDSYFDFMLERERDRQDLRMNVAQQKEVLRSIAKDMIELGYTAEERDYIVDYLLGHHSSLLSQVRQQYSSADKPSKEELSNKLASHALLDRSSQDPNKIGFINEFVFGNFIADNILATREWLSDDLRFIEPAVLSYSPRTVDSKERLLAGLATSLPFLDTSSRISVTTSLSREIPFPLVESEAESIAITGVKVGSHSVQDFQFNDCQFSDCHFILENMHDVNFLNCRFYGCTTSLARSGGAVYVLGGAGDVEFLNELQSGSRPRSIEVTPNRQLLLDRYIIDKLWSPADSGTSRPSRATCRPIKVLCYRTTEFTPEELYGTVNSLMKRGLVVELSRSRLLKLNFDALDEIREIRNGQDV